MFFHFWYRDKVVWNWQSSVNWNLWGISHKTFWYRHKIYHHSKINSVIKVNFEIVLERLILDERCIMNMGQWFLESNGRGWPTVTDDLVGNAHDGLLEEAVLSERLQGTGQRLTLRVHLMDLSLWVVQVSRRCSCLPDKLLQILEKQYNYPSCHVCLFLPDYGLIGVMNLFGMKRVQTLFILQRYMVTVCFDWIIVKFTKFVFFLSTCSSQTTILFMGRLH